MWRRQVQCRYHHHHHYIADVHFLHRTYVERERCVARGVSACCVRARVCVCVWRRWKEGAGGAERGRESETGTHRGAKDMERCFYINLDSRPDRRKQMEGELRKAGIADITTRVAALTQPTPRLQQSPRSFRKERGISCKCCISCRGVEADCSRPGRKRHDPHHGG